jgi:hypothetical protein
MSKKDTLKNWTHPKTGERRIYVNSSVISWGDKVFLTEGSEGECVAHMFIETPTTIYRQIFGGNKKIDWAWGILAKFDVCPLATKFDEIWNA